MRALTLGGLAAVAGIFAVATSAASAPVPVKASSRNEAMPSAGGDYIAWSKSRRGAPRAFDVYVQRGSEPPVKVNAPRTQGFAGGIDGTRLAYQEISRRGDANIRFFDLSTRRRSTPPGVNTKRYEFRPTISGDWLLFSRGVLFGGSTQQVILRNLVNGEQRVLASLRSRNGALAAGQVNGNFAVWMKCASGACGVFRYDLTTQAITQMPSSGKFQYGPSVTATGTTYYGQSSSGCGNAVELVKTTLDGITEVLYSFPAGIDLATTYTTTILTPPPGRVSTNRVYFDRGTCATQRLDVFSLDDTVSSPPPG